MRRKIYLAIAALAMAAMALPVIGVKVGAAGGAKPSTAPLPVSPAALTASAVPEPAGPSANIGLNSTLGSQSAAKEAKRAAAAGSEGQRLSDAVVLKAFGITQRGGGNSLEISKKAAEAISSGLARRKSGGAVAPESGEPANMLACSALSAAIVTSEGGRDTQFDEVLTLGDWDGLEDFSADHSGKVDDFSQKQIVNPGGTNEFTITREAISEHTLANGFTEDIFYYGDSFGNVYVAATTNLNSAFPTPNVITINLPTVLNAFGTLNSDDQIVITGLAVSPVVDLTSFSNVNGLFASFANLVGEVLYVSFTDTESGFRLLANGTPVRSGVLAFPVADIVSAAAAPPGILSPAGYPVQVGGAFGVAFSVFSNIAGCCVDDDGSLYFSQVDLVQLKGGNIVKINSFDQPNGAAPNPWQDRSLATNGFYTLTTLTPTNGQYGTTSGPTKQVNVATNYSGAANLFGNVMALACGPCNTVYAAVARSLEPGDDQFTQTTEGFFSTAGTALGATPTMVIRFADAVGAFAPCTVAPGATSGGLPIGDGFADPATTGIPLLVPPQSSGAPTLTPGVNNFRVFVLGNGPDIRGTSAAAALGATTANTLKISDGVGFQVDATIHSGITVDEASTVYVVSGGTPAGIGTNPSPTFGEILAFPDACPADGRADFIDLRPANVLPNPPSGQDPGNPLGGSDGLSTRADHIFWQAPIDVVTGNTPTGIAGLNRGFLLYTNRLRTHDRFNQPLTGLFLGGTTPQLPNGTTQGDDATNGPIIFELFDPCHQVAGGDDQTFPFRGDDNDGAGSPAPLVGPLSGGFEFLFANPVGDVFQVGPACGTGNGVWNGFWLNSNGSITFGGGDTSNIANVPAFRSGFPKIAAAWFDLNPASSTRGGGVPAAGFTNTFPVQALGFAGINDFRIRWINVPEFGFEVCDSRNTMSIDLYDDGTGVDENNDPIAHPLNPANPIGNNAVPFDQQEGPTALRFVKEPVTGIVVGCPPRQDGTGHFCLQFCRMDVLGTDSDPVITGFSIGAQNPLNPPGLCSTNLSAAARAADTDPFRPCLIGEGTEPEIFEFFAGGHGPSIGSGGEISLATPVFDLRFEGNDPGIAAALTPRQQDQNRGEVCFFGTTCSLPPDPTCIIVVPNGTVAVPPGNPAVGTAAAATPNPSNGVKTATPSAGIVNALCNVTLNEVGCGIIPNETTIICQGFNDQTGLPLQRPGKTVTTSMTLFCDTAGDGVFDTGSPNVPLDQPGIGLTSVTPVSANLVQGTLAVIPGLPGTAFPLSCCGGFATLVTTTTFTPGNNNIFSSCNGVPSPPGGCLASGGFTRQMSCVLDLGVRAPVVISASPSGPIDCSNCQDLLVTGSCFLLPNGTTNVTSVFAVDIANSAKVIQATRFVVLSPTLIDALFCFGSANAGHTFLIFASVTDPADPRGTISTRTSRNLSAASGTCPLGNEQGIQVTFKCLAAPVIPPTNVPTVTACSVSRNGAGKFVLSITGTNIGAAATITVSGQQAKKTKLGPIVGGVTTSANLIGGFCGNLPGPIVVTNADGTKSQPFQCNATCATQ